jgi:hypothetical protein
MEVKPTRNCNVSETAFKIQEMKIQEILEL